MQETMSLDMITEDAITGQYLTFRVQEGEYGIGIEYVNDIIQIQKITPVPHTGSYVKGIMNQRGTIVPVVDMRVRFNLPEEEYTDRTCVVVLEMDNARLGLIVDEVQEVLKNIDDDALQAPPKAGGREPVNRFVKAIGTANGRVKQFLDIYKVFEADY